MEPDCFVYHGIRQWTLIGREQVTWRTKNIHEPLHPSSDVPLNHMMYPSIKYACTPKLAW